MKNLKYLALNFACLLIIGWLALVVWQYQTTVTNYGGSDYVTFYHALHGNRNIYENSFYTRPLKEAIVPGKSIITTYAKTSSLNLNTPLMSLFLKGLVNISDQLSINTAAWTAASLTGAAIGFWILLSITASGIKSHTILPLFLALLLCNFSLDTLYAGQISFFIFPILCLSFKFCHDKQSIPEAITLGLLAAMKLFFLVFVIYYLAKKEWRLSLIMILSCFVFFFLPLLHFNTTTFLHFFGFTHNYFELITRSAKARNGSLLGFIANLSYFLNSKITMLQLRYIAYGAVTYFLIRSVIYDAQVLQKLPAFSESLRFSFYIIIGLLCSPLAWIYYFVFLIVPIAVLFQINQRYQLGKLFHTLFFLGLTLTAISYTSISPNKISWLLCARQFSTFSALLCWLIALIIAASCIKKKKFRSKNTKNMLPALYVIASLIAIAYIQITLGKLYFLTWRKTAYLESMKPTQEIIQPKLIHDQSRLIKNNPETPRGSRLLKQKNHRDQSVFN